MFGLITDEIIMNIQLPTAECTLQYLSGQIRRRLASDDCDLDTRVHDFRKDIKLALAVLWLNKPVWQKSTFWVSSLKSVKNSLGQLRDQSVLLDSVQVIKKDGALPDLVLSQLSIDLLRQRLALKNERLLNSRIMHAQSELYAFVDELELRFRRGQVRQHDQRPERVANGWMGQRLNMAVTTVINASAINTAETEWVMANDRALHQYRQQVKRLYYLFKMLSCCIERKPLMLLRECIQTSKTLGETLGLYLDYSALMGHTKQFPENVALYRLLQVAAKNRCLKLASQLPSQQSKLTQTLHQLLDAHIEVA
jgi:hypothetical protein